MYCMYCGTKAEPGDIFCANCGAKLSAPEPVQLPSEQPAEQDAPCTETVVIRSVTSSVTQETRTETRRTVQPRNQSTEQSKSRSAVVAFLLCLFFGWFGVHQFYAGRWVKGILYMFTFGLCGIGWVIDLILILAGRFKDSDGKYI